MHGYNTVEHSTTGANNCTDVNYWLAGWLADEMRVDFKIFKILYRLNYLNSYFV